MKLEGRTVLILGGAGLVGHAIARRLLAEGAGAILVGGLTENEASAAVQSLAPYARDSELIGVWGNLFVRASLAILEPAGLATAEARSQMLADDLGELTGETYRASHLVQLILGESSLAPGRRPDIVVDAVNTATALAYGGVYPTLARGLALRAALESARLPEDIDALLAAHSIPKLVRHMQLLSQALIEAGTSTYVKVGTTGTGGMGLNIPYTHGEEKPSRVLLHKSALAGAHSMLLFVLARTPGAPAVKEIKPAATITWKQIAYGPIRRRGRNLDLHDCAVEEAIELKPGTPFSLRGAGTALGVPYQSVYVDTGENGLFSLAEYTAITALGQMEAVTPEEIAAVVAREIMGRPTGRDVVAALDAAVMGPGYRAGSLRSAAIQEAESLVARHGAASIAFEILGPPRLSKLLYEAELLRRIYGTLDALAGADPSDACAQWGERIADDDEDLRRAAISVGVAILLPDGRRLLCAERAIATNDWERAGWNPDDSRIERSCQHEWVDLRHANAARWIERAQRMVAERDAEAADPVRSSGLERRFVRGFDIGEVAAWIFQSEDGGYRE